MCSLRAKATRKRLQSAVIIIDSYYFYNIGKFIFLFYSWNNHHKPEKFAAIMQKKSLTVIKEQLCTNSPIEKSRWLYTKTFDLEEIDLKLMMLINVLRE